MFNKVLLGSLVMVAITGAGNLSAADSPAVPPAPHADLQSPWFSVQHYGASAQHKQLATSAIQKAIDAAHASGGGQVYFPPGDYLSGMLRLKDNVTLYLEAGATLMASTKEEDFTPIRIHEFARKPSYTLTYAEGCKNIGIHGKGTIDGQARHELREPDFVDGFIVEETENARQAGVDMRRHFKLPPEVFLIYLLDNRNLSVQDVTIKRSPVWSLHIQWCRDVTIRGIKIYSDLMKGGNADGIDIDGCSNVVISDCIIETGDDAICMKTTRKWGRTQPCENITVSNCCLVSSSTALKLGTDSYSDFRNIVFSGCTISNSNRGLSIVIRDGGTASNVLFSDITFEGRRRHYHWWGDGEPIFLTVLKRTEESKVGAIRNIRFRNIVATSQGTSRILGFAGGRRLQDIQLQNVSLQMEPEEKPDKRATDALRIEEVSDLDVSGVRARQGLLRTESPVVHLQNCHDGVIRASRALPGTGTFLELSGEKTAKLWITGIDWSRAVTPYRLDPNAKGKSIRIESNLGARLSK